MHMVRLGNGTVICKGKDALFASPEAGRDSMIMYVVLEDIWHAHVKVHGFANEVVSMNMKSLCV